MSKSRVLTDSNGNDSASPLSSPTRPKTPASPPRSNIPSGKFFARQSNDSDSSSPQNSATPQSPLSVNAAISPFASPSPSPFSSPSKPFATLKMSNDSHTSGSSPISSMEDLRGMNQLSLYFRSESRVDRPNTKRKASQPIPHETAPIYEPAPDSPIREKIQKILARKAVRVKPTSNLFLVNLYETTDPRMLSPEFQSYFQAVQNFVGNFLNSRADALTNFDLTIKSYHDKLNALLEMQSIVQSEKNLKVLREKLAKSNTHEGAVAKDPLCISFLLVNIDYMPELLKHPSKQFIISVSSPKLNKELIERLERTCRLYFDPNFKFKLADEAGREVLKTIKHVSVETNCEMPARPFRECAEKSSVNTVVNMRLHEDNHEVTELFNINLGFFPEEAALHVGKTDYMNVKVADRDYSLHILKPCADCMKNSPAYNAMLEAARRAKTPEVVPPLVPPSEPSPLESSPSFTPRR